MSGALRIANCSGFYGDRLSAMREVLVGGEVDVVTGDYLAELTMLILGRDRMRDPALGFARTFVRQVEDCLGDALERGVRIVSNAGGLNPSGLADALRGVAAGLGLDPAVAFVDGDDLLPRAADLGWDDALTANAYLGGLGIARALAAGADIVVTGRVTDASLVVGPAVWHHGWTPESYDEIAGAMVAGHVIECGTQATGGNFSGFLDLPARRHVARLPGGGGGRRRLLGDHQARRLRRAGQRRHRDRPADVRGAGAALPGPGRDRRPRVRDAGAGGSGPRRRLRRPRQRAAGAAEGVCERARRLPQPGGARADRPRRRGEGCLGAGPARAAPVGVVGDVVAGRGHPPRTPTPRRAPPCSCGARSATRTRRRSTARSPAPSSSRRWRPIPASR